MIDKTITSVWTLTLTESEVFNRVVDESLRVAERVAGKGPVSIVTDDDKADYHRYYLTAVADLNLILARRTARVGGSIITDHEAGTTTYTLPMTDNHEDQLLTALASHCLDFIIARILEQWYGVGTDFGSDAQRKNICSIIHYRRFPIERPVGPLF